MIDIACGVASIGAVDRPPAVDLEHILGADLVGHVGGEALAPILDDELAPADRIHGKQPQARSRPSDPEGARPMIFAGDAIRPGAIQPGAIEPGAIELGTVGLGTVAL